MNKEPPEPIRFCGTEVADGDSVDSDLIGDSGVNVSIGDFLANESIGERGIVSNAMGDQRLERISAGVRTTTGDLRGTRTPIGDGRPVRGIGAPNASVPGAQGTRGGFAVMGKTKLLVTASGGKIRVPGCAYVSYEQRGDIPMKTYHQRKQRIMHLKSPDEMRRELMTVFEENHKLLKETNELRAQIREQEQEPAKTSRELEMMRKRNEQLVTQLDDLRVRMNQEISFRDREIFELKLENRKLNYENEQNKEKLESATAQAKALTPKRRNIRFSEGKKSCAFERLADLSGAIDAIVGPCEDDETRNTERALMIKRWVEMQSWARGLFKLPTLTAQQDLALSTDCALSAKQRRHLKSGFLKQDMDVFAPTHAVEKLRKDLPKDIVYDIRIEEHVKVVGKTAETMEILVSEMKDVHGALTARLQRLLDQRKLRLDGKFNNQVWITVVGDKGGTTTKLSLIIGNVCKPNSCYNLMLCGLLEAEDTAVNLRKYFGNVAHQIDSLKSVTVDIDGNSVDLEILLFVTGDYKYKWAVLGMKSTNQTHDCLKCFRSKGKKVGQRELDSKLRVVADFFEDSKKGTHGVKEGLTPMFPSVPITRYIPCMLHIISGLADMAFLNYVIELAKALDAKEVIGDFEPKKKRIRRNSRDTLQEQLEDMERRLADCKTAKEQQLREFRDIDITQQCMAAIQNKSIVPAERIELCSTGNDCVMRHRESHQISKDSTTWLQCDLCKAWCHYCCELIFSAEDILKYGVVSEAYVCTTCQGVLPWEKRNAIMHRQKDETVAALEKLKKEEKKLMDQRAATLQALSSTKGKNEKELERRLQKAGADLRAFHQKLTGNHIYKLLRGDGPNIIFGMFEETEETKKRKELMRLLATIQSFSSTKDLDANEIENYQSTLNEFENALSDADPTISRTPKLHALLKHTVPFLQEFGSLGMTTEQGQEADHQRMEKLLKRFAPIRNKKDRMRAVLAEHDRQMILHDMKDEYVEWWKETSNEDQEEEQENE